VVDRTGLRAPNKRGLPAGHSDRSLSSAKARFMDTVSDGVEELTRRCGFSRERAANTLLRELSRGDVSLSDDEVFHMMRTQGVGMEDARKALTISKAVLRAMKDNGGLAVQAIDDLTSRLNIVSLLNGKVPLENEGRVDYKMEPQRQRPQTTDRVPKKFPHVSRKQKPKQPKIVLEANHKTLKFSGITKTSSRKRSISGSDERKSRGRSDSVSEEVNAKIAQSCDGAPAEQSHSTIPVVSRGKRCHPDSPSPAAQPTLKRPRASEI